MADENNDPFSRTPYIYISNDQTLILDIIGRLSTHAQSDGNNYVLFVIVS